MKNDIEILKTGITIINNSIRSEQADIYLDGKKLNHVKSVEVRLEVNKYNTVILEMVCPVKTIILVGGDKKECKG